MAQTLTHQPSQIVRQLLIDLGLGTNGGTWPVYYGKTPDLPDSLLVVNDIEPQLDGQLMPSGAVVQHRGIQIMVRAALDADAWLRADALITDLAGVLRRVIVVSGTNYMLQKLANIRGPIRLGMEREATHRHLYTINMLAAVKQM